MSFEPRFGQGHTHPREEQQRAANNAAPRQRPRVERQHPVLNAAAGRERQQRHPAANPLPHAEPPPPPPQAAGQAYVLPAHCVRADHDYHATVARSRPADLDRLAFQPGNTNPDQARLSYDCEIMPDDTALPYDELVRRSMIAPLPGQGDRPAAAPREPPALPRAADAAMPRVAPFALPQAAAAVNQAVPARPPAQNIPARAPPPAAHAVNANRPLRNGNLPLERNAPQQRIAPDMIVNINTLGQDTPQAANRPLGMNNNTLNLANMGDFGQTRPQGLNFPISIPQRQASPAWLDNDAEAKELFQQTTAALEQKRDELGYDQQWVSNAQRKIHELAHKRGIDAAKAKMRDTAQILRRWEQTLCDLDSMGGAMGGNFGGYGMGFGGGFGGMRW